MTRRERPEACPFRRAAVLQGGGGGRRRAVQLRASKRPGGEQNGLHEFAHEDAACSALPEGRGRRLGEPHDTGDGALRGRDRSTSLTPRGSLFSDAGGNSVRTAIHRVAACCLRTPLCTLS